MRLDRVGSKQWMGFGYARPHTVGAPMRDFVRQDETPPVAASDAGDEAEQRCAPRFTLLIRAAKLISSAGEFLCVVREIGEGVAAPVPPCRPTPTSRSNAERGLSRSIGLGRGRQGGIHSTAKSTRRIVDASRFSRRAEGHVEVRCDMVESAAFRRRSNI